MITLLLTVHIMVAVFFDFYCSDTERQRGGTRRSIWRFKPDPFWQPGAATFFSKLTTIAAVAFMLTSLSLAIVSTKSGSVVKKDSSGQGKN